MRYFMLQAFAITFEDLVLHVGKVAGWDRRRGLGRVVGYLWVLAWFTVTHPIWLDPQIEVGFVSQRPPNVILAVRQRWFA